MTAELKEAGPGGLTKLQVLTACLDLADATEYLRGVIQDALAGNGLLQGALWEAFDGMVNAGRTPPHALLEYVAQHLRSPAKRSRATPKELLAYRRGYVVSAVNRWIAKGASPSRAYGEVAGEGIPSLEPGHLDLIEVDEKTVRDLYEKA